MSGHQEPHYSVVIQWSDEDGIYVVSLPEWGDLIHIHGATYDDALQQGKELLGDLIATRRDAGQPLPEPGVFASE